MWKYFTKQHNKEFILSLNLIHGNLEDEKKLNILYAISNHPEKYYTLKYINKKNGKKRELLIPNKTLKSIQKNILKNVLYGLSVSKYVTSYQKNKTLIDNARPHVKQNIILKLDIKDFFKNIDFEKLYNALPNYLFPSSIKVLLIKLCTYEGYLPQGSPTSPYLSNLVLKNFDNYMGNYCELNGINYTRYCDDLTFSGNFNPKKLINKVRAYLEELGFNLNEEKTKIITKNKRQTVTGLIVNEKINTPSTYRKKIRQEMYYINKYGLNNHCQKINQDKEKYIANLKGRINYCLSISPNNNIFKEYQKRVKKY